MREALQRLGRGEGENVVSFIGSEVGGGLCARAVGEIY